jgi:toxin-antitoxin system PIN domain toxin
VRPYLLDTNVLLALAWPNHMHHRDAVEWFRARGARGFATCPLTQTGFVRISANPSFTAQAVTPAEAIGLLSRLTALPGHRFWPDDLPLADACPVDGLLATHRQVTDAYLLALAGAHDGVLATLDRGIQPLARKTPERLELLGGPSQRA